MAAHADAVENNSDVQQVPLRLLSVVIPAHNEEGCIVSTVEHLHLELRLQNVPHEIVVVDDGSSDATWQKLLNLRERIPTLKPVQNRGPHGFGRAVEKGFASKLATPPS
jgi:dolichol-phosphate mannosyltransferase